MSNSESETNSSQSSVDSPQLSGTPNKIPTSAKADLSAIVAFAVTDKTATTAVPNKGQTKGRGRGRPKTSQGMFRPSAN